MSLFFNVDEEEGYRIARNIGVVQIWRIDQKMYLEIKNLTTPRRRLHVDTPTLLNSAC